jgi:hypothetical protein
LRGLIGSESNDAIAKKNTKELRGRVFLGRSVRLKN